MLNDVNGIPSVQGLPSGLHLFQNMGNGTYVGIPSWSAFTQLANSTPNAQVAFANPNNTTLMQAINSGQTVFNANQLENTEANAYYSQQPS